MLNVAAVSATPTIRAMLELAKEAKSAEYVDCNANCTEVKMASQEPARAVTGRAAIQPNNTNVGMSAAINISNVVTRGSS